MVIMLGNVDEESIKKSIEVKQRKFIMNSLKMQMVENKLIM